MGGCRKAGLEENIRSFKGELDILAKSNLGFKKKQRHIYPGPQALVPLSSFTSSLLLFSGTLGCVVFPCLWYFLRTHVGCWEKLSLGEFGCLPH